MEKNEKSEERREKILSLLIEHPEGMDIKAISDDVGAHRNTVARDLDLLRWKYLIVVKRTIGTVSLYYHKKHAKKLRIVNNGDKVKG